MRIIYLTIIFSFLFSALSWAGELGPKLQEALDGDATSFDVVITLKKKLNGKKIRRIVSESVRGDQNIRREVINRLKEQSAEDQESIRNVLSRLTPNEARYLWAVNSISLELDRDAITELLAHPKVEEIELNVVEQFLEPGEIRDKNFRKRFGKREIKFGETDSQNKRKNKRKNKKNKNKNKNRDNDDVDNDDVNNDVDNNFSGLAVGDPLPGFNSFNTYGVEVTQADDVHSVLGVTGKGVVVAVLDTGIRETHVNFNTNAKDVNGNAIPRFVTGASFVAAEPNTQDFNNHGTHCAGTVKDVAPDVQLMAVKVLAANGSGGGIGIIQGIQFAVAQGAHVLSMSLGTASDNPGTDGIENAVNNAVATGAVVVCANGNSGPNARTVGSPGSSPFCIAVGAHDSSGNIAGFSSRGPNADGANRPDVAAPGVSIRSSIATNGDTGFAFFSGTSMATPHVAGGIALALEVVNPALERGEFALPENTTMTAFLKDRLQQTVVGDAIPNVTGAGLANFFNFVEALVAEATPPAPEPEPQPEPQETDFTEEKVIQDTINVLRQVYGNNIRFFRFFLNGAIEINQEERTAVVRLFVQRFLVSFATFNVRLDFTLQHSNPEAPVEEAVFNWVVSEESRQELENTKP